jgi:hypothetical protein
MLRIPAMPTESPPRTVLHVRRTDEGDVEIALVVQPSEDAPDRRSVVLRAADVPTLIEMLRAQVEEEQDPEDRSTLRNLRPVT